MRNSNEDSKLSFFDKIKIKEEKAKRADELNKKNRELTLMLSIFYICWIGCGIYLLDFTSYSAQRTIELFAWSFAILIPIVWK